MSTTYESGEVFEPAADAGPDEAPGYDTTEGRVFTVSGGDWDSITLDPSVANERIVVNMGPQHPSTHGVLRLILELEGESVQEARCGIGYLHTGIEKNLEYRSWTQGTTFVTRMDYLSSFFNETAYSMAVEKLLGITDDIPDRATVIRVILMELNRVGSHLVCLGTGALELGALTATMFGFRERELVLDLFELITGLRMNHAFIRPGRHRPGPAGHRRQGPGHQDPHPVDDRPAAPPVQGHRQPAGRQHHLDGPHLGHRLPGPHRLHRPGRHRSDPARHRLPVGRAQGHAVLRLRALRVRGPHPEHLRRVRPLPDPPRGDAAEPEHRRAGAGVPAARAR